MAGELVRLEAGKCPTCGRDLQEPRPTGWRPCACGELWKIDKIGEQTRACVVRSTTWIELSPWWSKIQARAKTLTGGRSSERWRTWGGGDAPPELIGVAGEVTYAIALGLSAERALKRDHDAPDGGTDFGITDVKSIRHGQTQPFLSLPVDDAEKPTLAQRFALVSVDVETRRGHYLGSTSRERLLAAPVRHWSHVSTHSLPAADLER